MLAKAKHVISEQKELIRFLALALLAASALKSSGKRHSYHRWSPLSPRANMAMLSQSYVDF